MKTLLASVDRLPAGRAAAIRGALGPETVRLVEDASGVEWLPLEANVRLSHALHAVLEPGEFDAFHRSHFLTACRGPLFGAILDGVVAMFGYDLDAWARFVPTGWSATFRECGRWSIAPRASGVVEMVLRDLPARCVLDRVWPSSVAASLSALLDLGQADGAVDLLELRRRRAEAVYLLRWNLRPA